MLEKRWMLFEDVAVSAIIIPVFLLISIFIFAWGHEKYFFWSAEAGLYEFDKLSHDIKRETNFIKKRGGEIAEIRSFSSRSGTLSRESYDERSVLMDSCIELKADVGRYNKLVQPAYSLVMSEPISMQIHKGFDSIAMSYCDKYGGWR